MTFETDEDLFPVRCPHCKHKFYETIGRLKARGDIRCVSADCGMWIGYEIDQFLAALEEARDRIKVTAVGSFASAMQRKIAS